MEAKVTAKYLNEVEVAGITGRALSTLRNERGRGLGIPYIKIGRSVRYDFGDVIRFMDAHKIMTQCSLQQDGSVQYSGQNASAYPADCVFCPGNPNRKEAVGISKQ